MSEKPFTSKVSFTRPSNTNTYGAGDVVGAAAAALEFTNLISENGHIMITDVDFRIDLATRVAGQNQNFRLHLYNVTPPSALADEATWDLPAGDRASYLGYVDLGVPLDVGSTLFVQTGAVNKKLQVKGNNAATNAGTSLFAYLVTVGGYVAASATVYTIRLNGVGL